MIKNLQTMACGDLYAYVIERSSLVNHPQGTCGMIVPISITSTDGFGPLRELMNAWKKAIWTTSYAMRPGKLFDGVEKHLSIFLANNSTSGNFNGRYHRWNSEARKELFDLIQYIPQDDQTLHNGSVPKIATLTEQSILRKIKKEKAIGIHFRVNTSFTIYHTRKLRYFLQFLDQPPKIYDTKGTLRVTSELKSLYFDNEQEKYLASSIFLSSLFFWYYIVYSDCRNLNKREVESFPIRLKCLIHNRKLIQLGISLQKKLQDDSVFQEANYKKYGLLRMQVFSPRKTKSVVDSIDTELAKYYKFSEYELDNIIAYDIKFRMGETEED